MHRLGLPVERILRALAFDAGGIFQRSWDAPANTFDHPTLEFLMASSSWVHEQDWSPYTMIGVEIAGFPGRDEPITGRELAERCFMLRWISGTGVQVCDAALLAPGAVDAAVAYADLVDAFERADRMLLVPEERRRLVDVLLSMGERDRAALLVDGRDTPRHQPDLLLARARVKLARGEPLDDALLSELHGAGPMDPDVREVIARVAAQRGDRLAGLRHLGFLRAIGVPSPAAQQLEREWSRPPASRQSTGGPS